MTDASAPAPAIWCDRLWSSVLDGDERAAVDCVLDALDAGVEPQSVLLDVIAATQRKVGEEWAADRLTVAQEHAATAINERAVAALSSHPACRQAPVRGRITVACVDGEWHALPARLLAEVLRLEGWRVDFLGAQVPSPHLVTHLHRTGPDAVALSGSLPTRLPTAHAAITACRAASVPVLAGGAAFGADGRWAKLLRADAWAPDARAAAELLAGPLPVPEPVHHRTVDALPHLSDHEYTMVASARSKLVQDTMAGMADRFPPMREYTELQRRHTAEDMAHIVDHLACALYVDDDVLFTDFLNWTTRILTSRRVPAQSLVLALDTIGLQLHDFPRASGFVRTAREALARTASSPSAGIPT